MTDEELKQWFNKNCVNYSSKFPYKAAILQRIDQAARYREALEFIRDAYHPTYAAEFKEAARKALEI